MTARPLAEKVAALSEALADVPHAFGGALCLAYYAEPRATVDIDVNIFLPVEQDAVVLERLGALGIDTAPAAPTLRAEGQVRLWWDATPVDLFFAYDRFHDAASRDRRVVPFGDATIPVLSAEHLVVCKVLFDRPKDWVDIDAVLGHGTVLDAAEVLRWVGRIAGDEDHRYERIAAVLTTGPGVVETAPPFRPRRAAAGALEAADRLAAEVAEAASRPFGAALGMDEDELSGSLDELRWHREERRGPPSAGPP